MTIKYTIKKKSILDENFSSFYFSRIVESLKKYDYFIVLHDDNYYTGYDYVEYGIEKMNEYSINLVSNFTIFPFKDNKFVLDNELKNIKLLGNSYKFNDYFNDEMSEENFLIALDKYILFMN